MPESRIKTARTLSWYLSSFIIFDVVSNFWGAVQNHSFGRHLVRLMDDLSLRCFWRAIINDVIPAPPWQNKPHSCHSDSARDNRIQPAPRGKARHNSIHCTERRLPRFEAQGYVGESAPDPSLGTSEQHYRAFPLGTDYREGSQDTSSSTARRSRLWEGPEWAKRTESSLITIILPV